MILLMVILIEIMIVIIPTVINMMIRCTQHFVSFRLIKSNGTDWMIVYACLGGYFEGGRKGERKEVAGGRKGGNK